MAKPPAFHDAGMEWKYSDGTSLKIGVDGVARRPEPRIRQSKKARRLAKPLCKAYRPWTEAMPECVHYQISEPGKKSCWASGAPVPCKWKGEPKR